MNPKKAKAKYRARSGAHLSSKDAEILGGVLDDISKKHGEVSPEELVKRSRPKNSPTHHLFEWDIQKAAEEYWLQTARTLIGSLEVTFENVDEPIRAFPHVKVGDNTTYVPIARAMSDKELLQQLVSDALSQAKSWARRHEALRKVANLEGIFVAIDEAAAQ